MAINQESRLEKRVWLLENKVEQLEAKCKIQKAFLKLYKVTTRQQITGLREEIEALFSRVTSLESHVPHRTLPSGASKSNGTGNETDDLEEKAGTESENQSDCRCTAAKDMDKASNFQSKVTLAVDSGSNKTAKAKLKMILDKKKGSETESDTDTDTTAGVADKDKRDPNFQSKVTPAVESWPNKTAIHKSKMILDKKKGSETESDSDTDTAGATDKEKRDSNFQSKVTPAIESGSNKAVIPDPKSKMILDKKKGSETESDSDTDTAGATDKEKRDSNFQSKVTPAIESGSNKALIPKSKMILDKKKGSSEPELPLKSNGTGNSQLLKNAGKERDTDTAGATDKDSNFQPKATQPIEPGPKKTAMPKSKKILGKKKLSTGPTPSKSNGTGVGPLLKVAETESDGGGSDSDTEQKTGYKLRGALESKPRWMVEDRLDLNKMKSRSPTPTPKRMATGSIHTFVGKKSKPGF